MANIGTFKKSGDDFQGDPVAQSKFWSACAKGCSGSPQPN